jgi:hypothetical protein
MISLSYGKHGSFFEMLDIPDFNLLMAVVAESQVKG